jgi:hypothetical protein
MFSRSNNDSFATVVVCNVVMFLMLVGMPISFSKTPTNNDKAILAKEKQLFSTWDKAQTKATTASKKAASNKDLIDFNNDVKNGIKEDTQTDAWLTQSGAGYAGSVVRYGTDVAADAITSIDPSLKVLKTVIYDMPINGIEAFKGGNAGTGGCKDAASCFETALQKTVKGLGNDALGVTVKENNRTYQTGKTLNNNMKMGADALKNMNQSMGTVNKTLATLQEKQTQLDGDLGKALAGFENADAARVKFQQNPFATLQQMDNQQKRQQQLQAIEAQRQALEAQRQFVEAQRQVAEARRQEAEARQAQRSSRACPQHYGKQHCHCMR